MKLETILDAAEIALILGRVRQQRAFRARILRMDAEKDYAEACIIEDWHTIKQLEKRITEMESRMIQTSADNLYLWRINNEQKVRIVELEREVEKLYKEKANRGAAIRNM